MEQQILDTKRSYGQVFGEHQACFVQDEKFFDGAGRLVTSAKEISKPKKAVDVEVAQNPEEEFLRLVLTGAPVSLLNVRKQANLRSLDWNKIQDVALELGIEAYRSGKHEMWKLD